MHYAIALDIGTTNIQSLLVELSSKRQIDYLTAKNSQAAYGDDIITRLGLSLKDRNLQKKINKSVIEDIDLLIGLILRRKGLCLRDLERVIACGNAAMHHILLGLPLEGLAKAPFRPVHKGKIFETTLEKIGLDTKGVKIPFIFLPNLGGFVGSDALCVMAETGIYKSRELVLAVDLGTNGEIILGSEEKILVASTSAGPAFESWRVKCGLYGSAFIDVISGLLKDGTIDKSGFMKKGAHIYMFGKKSVEITQSDVREFQLAKAAISSGISILRGYFEGRHISKAYITGLFGAKLNKLSARHIGVFPEDIELKKIEIRENAALLGAEKILFSKDIEKEIEPILKKITHIELHKEPAFQDTFASAMHF